RVDAALSERGAPSRRAPPRLRPSLPQTARRAALASVAVDPGAPGGRGRRSQAPRVAAHAAPLVRHAPAGGRRRSARGPGDARPRRHLHHADLHAPAELRAQAHVPRLPPAGEGRRAQARPRMMAGRARTYPQVTPTAADLVDGAVVAAPAALSAGDGLRLARRRGVDVLAAGTRGFVLREDLARAESLGVGDLQLHRLTRPLPALA